MQDSMLRKPRTRWTAVAATLVVALTSIVGYAAASQAQETTGVARPTKVTLTQADQNVLDKQISRRMAKAPGGERIGLNQIAWDKGSVVLTLPLPGERTARGLDMSGNVETQASCSYYYVCLYTGLNLSGSRLSFTACKFRRLGDYGWGNVTSSWRNNQSSGTKSWLRYWDGNSVEILQDTTAPSSVTYVGRRSNNMADYLTVCQ